MTLKLITSLIFVFICSYQINAQEYNRHELLINSEEKINEILDSAFILSESEDYIKAVEYYKLVLDHPSILNDKQRLGKIYNQLANIHSHLSMFSQSVDYYYKAIRVYEEIDDKTRIAKTRMDLGTLYISMQNFSESFKNLFVALKHLESTGVDSQLLVDNYIYLGVTYGSNEQLDSALFYFDKAEQLIRITDDTLILASLYNNVGAIYSKKNDNDKALDFYSKSLPMFKAIGNRTGEGAATVNIALIKLKMGMTDVGINLIEKAIELFKSVNSLYYLSGCYTHLFQLHDSLGNSTKALKYYKMYVGISDSIMNSTVLNKTANIQHQYNLEKLDHEMNLVKKEKEIYRKESELAQIRQILIIAGFGLLIIIAVLLVISLRSRIKNARLRAQVIRQEKDKLSDELKFKTRELHNFALHMVQNNEFIEKIKEKVKTIKEHCDPKHHDKINELALLISQNVRVNKELEKIQRSVMEINNNFFNVLNKKYPVLTEKDKQLCAMIRMDFSSKEIAYLNEISDSAVIMARHRLRKKIGLSTDENLGEFLKTL